MEPNSRPQAEIEPVGQAVSKKKSSVLKTVLIVTGVVLFAGSVVLGYGFAKAYAIKSYAKKAEKIFAETKKWDEDDLESDDFSKAKVQIEKVQTDSDRFLVELNAAKAPAKAKNLEADLKEYFTKSKKIAVVAIDMIKYFEEIEKVTDIYANSFSPNGDTSPEAMIQDMERQKVQMEAALVEMDKLEVPTSMKASHQTFRKLMADSIPLFDQVITAFRNNDLNALMNISSTAFTETAAQAESTDPVQALEKDFGADATRLEQLEGLIPGEISKLKEINFTF